MNTAVASTGLEEAEKAVAEIWQAQCIIMHRVYQYQHAELQCLVINGGKKCTYAEQDLSVLLNYQFYNSSSQERGMRGRTVEFIVSSELA